MNWATDLTVATFALCNSVRVVAYLPQIARVMCDQEGAAAISCLTWLLFTVSHLSTVAYALLVISDWRMAAVFAANTLCCLLIIGLTVYKRAALRRQAGSTANSLPR